MAIAYIGSSFKELRYISALRFSDNFPLLLLLFLTTGPTENMESSGPISMMASNYLDRTPSTEWLTEDMNARCLWKLSLDEENNSLLRDEFFYEQVEY